MAESAMPKWLDARFQFFFTEVTISNIERHGPNVVKVSLVK